MTPDDGPILAPRGYGHNTHIFVVRISRDPGDHAGTGEWQGQVRHVGHGDWRRFHGFGALFKLVKEMLDEE